MALLYRKETEDPGVTEDGVGAPTEMPHSSKSAHWVWREVVSNSSILVLLSSFSSLLLKGAVKRSLHSLLELLLLFFAEGPNPIPDPEFLSPQKPLIFYFPHDCMIDGQGGS